MSRSWPRSWRSAPISRPGMIPEASQIPPSANEMEHRRLLPLCGLPTWLPAAPLTGPNAGAVQEELLSLDRRLHPSSLRRRMDPGPCGHHPPDSCRGGCERPRREGLFSAAPRRAHERESRRCRGALRGRRRTGGTGAGIPHPLRVGFHPALRGGRQPRTPRLPECCCRPERMWTRGRRRAEPRCTGRPSPARRRRSPSCSRPARPWTPGARGGRPRCSTRRSATPTRRSLRLCWSQERRWLSRASTKSGPGGQAVPRPCTRRPSTAIRRSQPHWSRQGATSTRVRRRGHPRRFTLQRTSTRIRWWWRLWSKRART